VQAERAGDCEKARNRQRDLPETGVPQPAQHRTAEPASLGLYSDARRRTSTA
jgi:hypothetical protein